MTKNSELAINSTENKIKLLEVIPSDKFYTIHNDFRKYYNKWTKDQVISLADTSGIENFYTTVQYLNRTIPVVGAGLVASGHTEAGVVTAGISLYADYLITSGKEKLFKSEEKKKKYAELTKDVENLYDKYEELTEILRPIRNSDSLLELNKLLETLKKELRIIAKKGEIKVNDNKLKRYLGYIFWSLRRDQSSNVEELVLLNNGIKVLGSWNNLSLTTKTWAELTRLFISLRNSDGLWKEWEDKWEARRSEHSKIKHLTSLLQNAISEYKQGISSEEIEEGIRNGMATELNLGVEEKEKIVVIDEQNQELQSSVQIPPKQN